MPFMHISTGGYSGSADSRDFTISDPDMAYVWPAKIMAMTAVDLLRDGAAQAIHIKKNYPPKFSRESYLKFINDLH